MADNLAEFKVYTPQAIATTQFRLHEPTLRNALTTLIRATEPLAIIAAFSHLSTCILKACIDIGADNLQPTMKNFLCFFLEQASKKVMGVLTSIMRQDSPPKKEDVVWSGKLDNEDYRSDVSEGGIGTRFLIARLFLHEMHNRQLRLLDPVPLSAEDVGQMVEAQAMRVRDTFLLVFGVEFEAEVAEDRDNMVIEFVGPEEFDVEEREETVRLGGLAIVAWAWSVGWFVGSEKTVEVWDGVWVAPWEDGKEEVVVGEGTKEAEEDDEAQEGEEQEGVTEEEEGEDDDDEEEGGDENEEATIPPQSDS